MTEAGLLADPQEVRAILVASAQAGQWISYSEVLACSAIISRGPRCAPCARC